MTIAEACTLTLDAVREANVVRAERDGYRLLAQQAAHLLHDQHCELTRLREQHHRLIAKYRALREQVVGKAA